MSKKHVKILRAARKRVEDTRDIFVCYAVDSLVNSDSKEEVRQIVAQIEADLRYGNYGWKGPRTLEGWLELNHGIPFNSVPQTPASIREYKRTRLAWIDAMIEYWKDK